MFVRLITPTFKALMPFPCNLVFTLVINIVRLCFLHFPLTRMKKTLLLQPRHIYAPPMEEGQGHIYSPTSLWTVGSKLIQAGADVTFEDENIRKADTEHADVIGVNLVGPPYIPVVRDRLKNVIDGNEQQLILGGQVITGLTRYQLSTLFGDKAISGLNITETAKAVGAKLEQLMPDEQTSLIPSYECISDEDMKEYLDPQREISFYLSQGCIFACKFCPAQKNMKERYRNMEIIEKDLAYLTEQATKLGIHQLSMYLSNLDIFQTAESLGDFAKVIQGLKERNSGFIYRIRGLATATSLVNTAAKHPEVVQAIKDAGLHTVGFGVDGGDERVWRSVKKGHNNEHTIIRAMEICREYGFIPENIMVFGHPEETHETLENAVHLTDVLQSKFGAVPRPHVAKDLIPGNDYWQNNGTTEPTYIRRERAERIKLLLEHPEYFQALDFKALASSMTHPNEVIRYIVNEYYRTITNMSGNPKELIYPVAPEFSAEVNALHRYWNKGRFDR